MHSYKSLEVIERQEQLWSLSYIALRQVEAFGTQEYPATSCPRQSNDWQTTGIKVKAPVLDVLLALSQKS